MAELKLMLALGLALLLVVFASPKFFALGEFRRILSETYRIRSSLVPIIAIGVPTVELVCAALLLVPNAQGVGFLASTATFSSFSVFASIAVVQGRSGTCGCLGALRQEPLDRSTAVRAFAMATLAAVGLMLSVSMPRVAQHGNEVSLLLGGAGVVILIALSRAILRLAVTLGGSRGPVRD
jgi:hypothetical protein